jgi:hypothetical protein
MGEIVSTLRLPVLHWANSTLVPRTMQVRKDDSHPVIPAQAGIQ